MMLNKLLMRVPSLIGTISDRKGFFLSFILGFIIRLIPEVLSYPYPIGFDTVYYATRVKSGVVWSSSWTAIFSTWLFEDILISVNKIVQMNPFLLLKLAVPLLYGLNVCGIYYFSRKAFNWSEKTALMAGFFFAFQLASLRMSWDLHKNLFGSAVLLFTLPLIRRAESKKHFALLLALSLLLVFSHTLVASVFFAVILAIFIDYWLKHERLKLLKLLLAVLPAFIVLFLSLLVFPQAPYTPENVIVAEDAVRPHPGGLSFLVNYLSVSDAVHNYPTYLDLFLHILSLFSVLYLWWLPLVLVGFFRNGILDGWTLLLLIGSFNALITPFCAIDWWSRWMFMLVYPFTFYAISGVKKLSESGGKSVVSGLRYLSWMKVTRKTVLGILSATVVLGSLFLIVPPFFDRFGVVSIPTTSSYLPSTMLYNSVPLRDVKSTIDVIEWLNEYMNDGSIVLVHRAFFWWTDIYLDKKHVILYFEKDIGRALEIALSHGFEPIYTVWWNENYLTWQNQSIGWYGLSVPKYFKYIFRSDRISVFQFVAD